ncbi:Imidazole glycerol phosphate synthase subunit hisF [Magnetospirillum gryphiswaldense MSR-1 v2]|uniref:Imidazole glycerol phosphate synthase subunit HisF n=1 Tax=Magnetospirillum gryphiswaldense (strain DSM 6361 / JCM 21280 / NBRC 15271 / MSR-1) TaxID=431944 RepID=V6F899_MAGGM|nr:imidazole glycerol phosphate synthase cyclase subunit [Magnetospirillum gryphiswaldense]CDL00631.1 Imidazole glycerol phosphate synthase subunit hisF [Magnetospirillum gryphiswaldense MSR-1 v2]
MSFRLIARLDVKAPYLIKGVHLEGLRKLGHPRLFSERYYHDGIDEIVYIDAVASLYQRNTITDLVRETAKNVFIPITVGGGIRSVEDAKGLLQSGADKVAVNTEAIRRPDLISEIANRFGAQCMVLSVQAKRTGNQWEAYCDQGRERTGLDVIDWVRRGTELGAGEILLTSVDREGTGTGFDLDLVRAVTQAVSVPVIASGGMGRSTDMVEAAEAGADAVAMARVLHYNEVTLSDVRSHARAVGLVIREFM